MLALLKTNVLGVGFDKTGKLNSLKTNMLGMLALLKLR
jgi:hypothetical protein